MAKEYQDKSLKVHKYPYNSPQDKSRKLENRKPVKIVFPFAMMLIKEDIVIAGKAIRRVAAEKIVEKLKERF